MGSEPGAYGEEAERALSVWIVINRAFAALTRRVEDDVRSHGFSITEFAVLENLYHKGPQQMAKIGEAILVTTGNVTYVVDKLVARGLVRRRPCDEDRRVIYAELTEEGQAVMARIFPQHAETIRQLMSVLDPSALQQLRDYMKTLGLSAQG